MSRGRGPFAYHRRVLRCVALEHFTLDHFGSRTSSLLALAFRFRRSNASEFGENIAHAPLVSQLTRGEGVPFIASLLGLLVVAKNVTSLLPPVLNIETAADSGTPSIVTGGACDFLSIFCQ